MAEAKVKVKTTAEVLGKSAASDLLHDIFADLHPGFIDESRDLASIFSPRSARDFLSQLTNLEAVLSEEDTYETTIRKLQGQIDTAEKVRDQLLAQVFEEVQPIEKSYR